MKIELLTGEPQERESKKAILACNDYLRMGPGRSLRNLLRIYHASTTEKPPTRHLETLATWSATFGWQARAAAYDAEIERQKNDYVQQVMKSGLALAHERVNQLKRLTESLLAELCEINEAGQVTSFKRDALWLKDAKQIGRGEDAERFDLVHFNSPGLDQLRGLLDDLARETGGRRQKRDNFNLDMSKLTDDQLERIAAGEDPLDVILSSTGRGGA
ncbi:MAG: hypothetical protein BroJett011_03880 [Chloroflexota bacterium]|nr:MAG: hypothetical protein BroJett011_03880 [Chloroflexota bacterium]